MLSLFHPSSHASELNDKTTMAPKVVDFNTIDTQKSSSDTLANMQITGSAKPVTLLSYLWPFSSSKTKEANDSDNVSRGDMTRSLLDASTDKVIAMKKVSDVDDDEFIDIQVRQLSYAEVSALDLVAKLKDTRNNNTSQKTKGVSSKVTTDFVVIDQEADLEKEITDMEMMDTLKNCPSTSHIIEDLYDSPEDEWEQNIEVRTSKKLSKKRKIKGNKKKLAN